jgi:hypothetical protein
VITSVEIDSSVTADEKKIDVAYKPLPVKKSNKIYFFIPVQLLLLISLRILLDN